MRARQALAVSGQRCELREIALRNKPPEMLAASPKAIVPVLVLPDGTVIDQSLDIMRWALKQHDPGQWLMPETGSPEAMQALIAQHGPTWLLPRLCASLPKPTGPGSTSSPGPAYIAG